MYSVLSLFSKDNFPADARTTSKDEQEEVTTKNEKGNV
jgi:hypothetical protein